MAWIVAALMILGVTSYGANAKSYLKPLADFIRANSDPDIVPVQSHGVPVYVSILFSLLDIRKVDDEQNTVDSEGVTHVVWQTGMTWDPAKYGGAESIALPSKYFWTPLLYPLDMAVELTDYGPKLVTLYHNGTASLESVYRSVGLCDVSNIATTGATCINKMSFWGYSKDEVEIAILFPDLSGRFPYFAGSRYELGGAGNIKFIDRISDGRVYQEVEFTTVIKEKPSNRHSHGPFKAMFQWH